MRQIGHLSTRTEDDGQLTWKHVLPAWNARRDDGFTLLPVIFGLAVISTIVVAYLVDSRYRIKAASNIVETIKAEALAEAGINIVLFDLIANRAAGGGFPQRFAANGVAYVCRVDEAGTLALSTRDEGGKIDLNAASTNLLTALFIGLGVSDKHTNEIVQSIIFFRTPKALTQQNTDQPSAANTGAGLKFKKQAPFETIYELDRVEHVDVPLFRAALPYLTVQSRRSGVDPQAASPKLLDILDAGSRDQPASTSRGRAAPKTRRLPVEFVTPSAGQAVEIRADVLADEKNHVIREAVVALDRPGSGRSRILEWRHGSKDSTSGYLETLNEAVKKSLPSCLN